MMRRILTGAALCLALLPAAAGAADPTWQIAQPAPPPPPEGAAPAPFPVPYGSISDISFWAPNRGLMAVDGGRTNGGFESGLYRWNGDTWSLYSTVCVDTQTTASGERSTKIIWAGPTEFWTITDPRKEATFGAFGRPNGTTLCHFKDGAVVGSYAVGPGQVGEYRQMAAGACRAADDCWFGGQALPAPDIGAFHLHWNGTTLSRVITPQGRPVTGMTVDDGTIYESRGVSSDSEPARLTFPEAAPALLSSFIPGADGPGASLPEPFTTTLAKIPSDGHELTALDSADGILWAVGGRASNGPSAAAATDRPPLLAVRKPGGDLTDTRRSKTAFSPNTTPFLRSAVDVAAEPGTENAWILFSASNRVARVNTDGRWLNKNRSDLPLATDPSPLKTGDLGFPTTIDCAAEGDCWLGTDKGWLFHYTDGAAQPKDQDPAFAKLITDRPDDGLSPTVFSDAPPIDDSGTQQDFVDLNTPILTGNDEPVAAAPTGPRARKVKVAAVGRSAFRITFTLTGRAKVKVTAKRGSRTVAQTKRAVLGKGPHGFTLRVGSAKRWPNKIDLDVREP